MPAASCVRQLAPSPDLPTRSLAPAAPLRIRTSFQPRRARDFDDDEEPLTPETPFSPVSFPSSSPPRGSFVWPAKPPKPAPRPPTERHFYSEIELRSILLESTSKCTFK